MRQRNPWPKFKPTMRRWENDAPLDPPFHESVQCFVKVMQYDFVQRVGVLMLPDHSCTDMEGAVNLFRRIDPDVRRVVAYQGSRPDVTYYRVADDWQCGVYPKGTLHESERRVSEAVIEAAR